MHGGEDVQDYLRDARRWIRKSEKKNRRSEETKIWNKSHHGGQKGFWAAVKMAQNKPENQIPEKMMYNNQQYETDEDLVQGFADFFTKSGKNN
jgi:hypothetical protein